MAQISLKELRNAIRGKRPHRLYFFYGEEQFLLRYYLERLRKLLTDELTATFNDHRFPGDTFQVQPFVDAVEGLPMMAEHTFVWVDDLDLFKLPEGDRNKLAETLGNIPDYCTVVFTYETVAWRPDKRQKKLWEVLDSQGIQVEFPKQDRGDLAAWVTRHFAARKKRISPALCDYLIHITGGTMTALAGEIDKIAAYSGREEIQKSDIDAVTEPVLDAVIFEMTDLIQDRRYGAALDKLHQLLQMQEEPVAILGAIGSMLRRLGAGKTLQDNRSSLSLAKLYGIPPYAAQRISQASRRASPRFCQAAAELVMETDYKMKTSFDDPARLLELLILDLAREAAHG